MQRTSLADMPCSVARTLDQIGEWWSLLIVRDAFLGARRFDEFRDIGVADNILSARLKRLVDVGIFERRLYQEHPQRYEYTLTDKGRDLMPVVGALRTWGQKWTTGKETSRLTHEVCGHAISQHMYCESCDRTIAIDEIQAKRIRRPAAV